MKNVTYINAGAGSGKTYTLTNKLAEELSNNRVEPSQVILTTFTELAATEFREKAREQILAAKNLEAAAQLDSAVIGTVHSMAYHFIKKFWYLLDYGADIQTISERDDEFYMSQSLARIVQEEANKDHLENFRKFRDYYDISDGSRSDYLFWQPILKSVVEKMEYYEVNDEQESIDESVKTLRTVFNGPALDDEIKKKVINFLNEYCTFCSKIQESDRSYGKAQTHIAVLKPLLENCDSQNLWEIFLQISHDPCDLLSPVKGKAVEKEIPSYSDIKDVLLGIPISSTHLDVLIPFVTSIFKLAASWRKDFKTYKQRNHIISYNDMEQLFLELITEYDEVKAYIKEHYQIVMVDEFQDSNPIQLKIFNQLSELLPDNGRSYWVGDPKQSIYGFRGADTELVNEVSKQFKFYDDDKWYVEADGFGTRRLIYSWRSRAKLVELVNDTIITPFTKDRIDSKLIKLEPHFKVDHPDVTYDPFVHWESKSTNAEVAAAELANKVKELLESNCMVHHHKLDKAPTVIHPYDVAILCRTNADAKEVVKALRDIGVAVSEPEDAIMQRIEIQLVVTLLQFMQNPDNKHVRADLLRLMGDKDTATILKERLQYLQQLAEENEKIEDESAKLKDTWLDGETFFTQLETFTQRLKNLSIPEMVDGLIYDYDIPALADKWGDGDIRRQNLSTLRKLAADYDQRCLQLGLGTSISGFVYFLNSTEPDKSPDNHSDTVKVLTYHGSKGLEWSMVVLNNLNNDALNQNECIKKSFMRVIEVDKKACPSDPFHKDYYLHYFPFILKNNSNPAQTLAENIAALQIYKDIHGKTAGEVCRLMYVGMTRAKDCLITFGRGGVPNKDGKISSAQLNEFNWLKNIGVPNPQPENVWNHSTCVPKCELTAISAVVSTPSTSTPTWNQVKKPEIHSDFPKRYLSPSKMNEFDGWKYTDFEEWKGDRLRMDTKEWGEDYATVGSCIHDFFAVFQPGEADANEELARRIIDGYGLTDKLKDSVGDIVQSAEWLHEQLRQRFPQTENDRIETEVPFQLTLENKQTLRGEMDLLWFYTDDKGQHCVLVDYKTFPGVAYAEHTKTHYAQLSAYAHALRKKGKDVTAALIYYPVGRVVHELKMKEQ